MHAHMSIHRSWPSFGSSPRTIRRRSLTLARKVMAYVVMANILVAYVVMAYVVMVLIVIARIVMADVVLAYVVMGYIFMARANGRPGGGLSPSHVRIEICTGGSLDCCAIIRARHVCTYTSKPAYVQSRF